MAAILFRQMPLVGLCLADRTFGKSKLFSTTLGVKLY